MQQKLYAGRLDFTCRFGLAFLMLALLLTSNLSTTLAAQSNPVKPDFAAIDAYVQSRMQEHNVPGLGLAIVQDNQIIYSKGFGKASSDGKSVTAQASFSIGSLTKSFTAIALMQLVEAGKLDLDAPVKRYLPWFKLADQSAADRITLRHLVTNSSGLPREFPESGIEEPNYTSEKLETGLRKLATAELEKPVGTYNYSNVGYQVLALVIQQASGQTYEAYIKQHIFNPLQMKQAFGSFAEVPAGQLVIGHNYWFWQAVATPGTPPFRAGTGAGGLFASTEDMGRYLIAHLNEGRFGTVSLLSAANVAELHKPALPTGKEGVFYGMGWDVQTGKGRTMLTHSGLSYNYFAKMLLVPERRLGVVVLQNSQYTAKLLTGDYNQDTIADGVASLLLGEQPAASTNSPWLLVLYAVLVLALGWQVAGVLRSLLKFRRWGQPSGNRPAGKRALLGQVFTPFGLHLAWGLFTLAVLLVIFGDVEDMAYRMPDLTYGVVVSCLLALGWGSIRTVWAYLLLRKKTF